MSVLDFKRVRVEAGTETATGNTDWNKVQCRKSSVKGGSPARDGREGAGEHVKGMQTLTIGTVDLFFHCFPKAIMISIYRTCILCINTHNTTYICT